MFIKSLKLRNWRSHLKTEFEFGKINLVRGPNNSGKSSLAGALEFVLTGRMAGTDERGAGADKAVTLGSKTKEATIEACIDANNCLQLTLKRSRGASGGNVTVTDGGFTLAGSKVDEFLAERGYGRDLLSASLRVGRFLSLSAADRRELLADLVAPPSIAVPDEMKEPLDLALNFKTHIPQTLESIRQIEADAVKARAASTAALRELGEPTEVKPADPDSPSALQCQKRLDSLRSEQTGLVKRKEQVLNVWKATVERHRLAVEQLPGARDKILNQAAEEALLDTIAKEAQINEATTTLSRLRFEIAELEGQIKQAHQKSGKCPTCGHEVELEDLLTRFRDGIAARQSRIPTLEMIVNGHDPIHVAREKLRVHREAVVSVDRLKAIVDDAPSAEPDTTETDKQIKDLEDRMQRGQTILAEVVKHESLYRSYLETMETRGKVERRREAADQVAKWAANVQGETSAGKVGEFKAAINEVLQTLGYDLQMTDEGFMLVMPFPIGQQRQVEQLSESEQWRFSVALQIAIAKVTGIGVVLLDRADMLVGENRIKLMEAAKATAVQVFIFASAADTPPAPNWLTVFELELDKEGHTKVKGKA